MLQAARERLDAHPSPPLLIAVTVLTSLDAADLAAVGCAGDPLARVLALARLSSGRRARRYRLLAVGSRPGASRAGAGIPAGDAWGSAGSSARGDQKRVMTPTQALAAGADYLVIGRPITAAAEPMQALTAIEQELAAADASGVSADSSDGSFKLGLLRLEPQQQ
jgi:orotidine-5'-phosphate decarboxylase